MKQFFIIGMLLVSAASHTMEKKVEALVIPSDNSRTINQALNDIAEVTDQEPYDITITNNELAQQAIEHYKSRLGVMNQENEHAEESSKKLLCVSLSLLVLNKYPESIDPNELLLKVLTATQED